MSAPMPIQARSTPLPLCRVATDFVSVLDGDRVAIRHGTSTHVIAWEDVVFVRSANKCTWIVTTHGEFKVLEALATVVDGLAILGLVRIHRAIAVSGMRVRQLVGRGRHRLTIVLDTGAQFDVGRQFQPLIRARFGGRRRAPDALRSSGS